MLNSEVPICSLSDYSSSAVVRGRLISKTPLLYFQARVPGSQFAAVTAHCATQVMLVLVFADHNPTSDKPTSASEDLNSNELDVLLFGEKAQRMVVSLVVGSVYRVHKGRAGRFYCTRDFKTLVDGDIDLVEGSDLLPGARFRLLASSALDAFADGQKCDLLGHIIKVSPYEEVGVEQKRPLHRRTLEFMVQEGKRLVHVILWGRRAEMSAIPTGTFVGFRDLRMERRLDSFVLHAMPSTRILMEPALIRYHDIQSQQDA